MKKFIITLILINTFANAETVLGIDKEEFQARILSSVIDGFTGVFKEAKNIMTNPPSKEKINCGTKYFELQKRSSKYWWDTRNENVKIKQLLSKRKINYSILLKQNVKEPKINIIDLKKRSCSESYFNFALQRYKADYKIGIENEILKRLAEQNNIEIKTKSLYQSIKTEKKAKKKLHIGIKSKEEVEEEYLQAMKDVD